MRTDTDTKLLIQLITLVTHWQLLVCVITRVTKHSGQDKGIKGILPEKDVLWSPEVTFWVSCSPWSDCKG